MTMTENRKTVLFIFIAFMFSFAVRMIWVYQFQDAEQFKFNNEFMINTNDGYFYAEGARDILAGKSISTNDSSPFESAGSILTAFIAKLVAFSFESVIFYLPAFLSSLLVIPIILIGKSIGKIEVGFLGALFGSIAWSYYNRTMVGYYDTDMLNIVFPTLLLWSLIGAIITREEKYLLVTGIEIIAYRWWYPQSYSLEFAFFGLLGLYVLYQYLKKQDFNYTLILMTFMMFAMMGLDGYFRFIIIVSLFIILKFKREQLFKYLFYLFILSLFLFMFTGGFDPIWSKLKIYVFKDELLTTKDTLSLHFFSVMQTVREAGQIPFETFANRISGNPIIFIFSLIGYVWLVLKHRVMILGLPLIGLGFLAYSGGLRFTVYAVPVLALAVAYLIYEVSQLLSKQFINDKVALSMKYIFIVGLSITVLYPNIQHIIGYKVPTVFTQNEVKVLDKLKHIATREDYVVGWWDYGYPIRYYSDVKTLVDGGKHSGTVNFPVSYILTNPEIQSAKMMRLDVEYTEQAFKEKKLNNITQMTLDYGFKDTNSFLNSLKTDIKLPTKTRDIYLYLPNRMMNIYPTVTLFSNLDLMTGKKRKQPFFYKSTNFKESKEFIDLGRGIKIRKQTGTVIIGKQEVPINSFVKTFYDKQGKLQKQIQTSQQTAGLNVIFMSNYHQFLVVEDSVYNSLYFQLFVLENYDKRVFEPTILTPLAKVFKLKI